MSDISPLALVITILFLLFVVLFAIYYFILGKEDGDE